MFDNDINISIQERTEDFAIRVVKAYGCASNKCGNDIVVYKKQL